MRLGVALPCALPWAKGIAVAGSCCIAAQALCDDLRWGRGVEESLQGREYVCVHMWLSHTAQQKLTHTL